MLAEKIMNDLKEAMKAGEAQIVSTLRMLNASAKNKKIELGKELDDADFLAVIKKEIKSLQDSLESFVSAARGDLEAKAREELAILQKYLPQELDDASLEEIVKVVVAEVGAKTKAEIGKVMGPVIKKVAGAADGKRIKEVVEKMLGGNQ
jgi:uncharacterized protein YqeY